MVHVFYNVMHLFDCQNLYIAMCCMSFLHLSLCLFVCYNMNLYFGPVALHNIDIARSDVCIIFVLILLYVVQGMYYRVCNMHV